MSGDNTVVHIVLPLFYMVLSLVSLKKGQCGKTSTNTILRGVSRPYSLNGGIGQQALQ